jgi:signal transduction histidine kinase
MLHERARIARELHDSVSQTLYAITVTAVRALRLLEQKESNEIQHVIDDVLQLANAGQSELRLILTNIHPDRLPSGGLTAGLATLAASVRTQTGLDVRLSLADEPDAPAAIKEALMLISREALHNVVKHADADRVEIRLEVGGGQMLLLIADDGRGFDPTLSRPGHFGMQSMRERAAIFGGALELVSTQGVGTQICVRLPVEVRRSRSVVIPQGTGR